VAKRRLYDIAKEKGLTNQELLDSLKSAGIYVKGVSSSVEEVDVARAMRLSPPPPRPVQVPPPEPPAEEPVKVVADDSPAAVQPPPKVASGKTSTGKSPKPAEEESVAEAAADGTVVEAAVEQPAAARAAEEPAIAEQPVAVEPPVAKPAVSEPIVKAHADEPAAEAVAETIETAVAPDAQPAAAPVESEVAAAQLAQPEPEVAPTVHQADSGTLRPMGARPVGARPEGGRPENPRSQSQRPEGARFPQSRPQGAPSDAPRPDATRPEGQRPQAPSAGLRKPVRRGPRLEDMPTVVGPGVPLRKGVKPSGNVVTKEELTRIQAEKEARAEAARKAAAAAPPKPVAPEQPAVERTPKPAPVGRPPVGGRPPRSGGFPRESTERGRERSARVATAPIPDVWAEAAEATGLVGPPRPGAPARVRRGDDKPAKRRVIIDSQAGRKGGRGAFGNRRGGPPSEAEKPALKKKVVPGTETPAKVKSGASVKDLSEALDIGAGELIKTLLKLGEMVTITQSLSDDALVILAEEHERKIEIEHAEEEKEGGDVFVDDPADLTPRAPVVTIMGHVDHGKTSLLDAIRETEVAKGEAGGITQHIGAYQVTHNERKVTFLDTPGHEAFTAMRARGAKSTDIAVIVVAANDGVMPQTLEAISHAKAAEVPMIVAINKMDLPDANPDLVKKQLADQGLVPEAWGGDTVVVEVSAKKRTNLDDLMAMILLVAEVQELKANAKAPATGVVIESQLDVGRGPVATVLVQRGTLRAGEAIVSGESYGKVKAMFDFLGKAITKAGPSVPVQVLGFNTLPQAGDFVMVANDEREARQKSEQRTSRLRQEQLAKSRGASSLDEFYRRVKEGRVKELPLVIKGDVAGSVEALEESLRNVSHPEVKVAIVFAGVGGINESDIMLASASKAVVIGFNVRPSTAAKLLAEQEQVDVRTYRVIYKAIEDVEAALVGMLEPEQVESELGTAEIRQVFHASRIGTIAGCYVQTGKITRSAKIRLLRNGAIIHEGTLSSLKRFSDDAREVTFGYECGIHVDGYDDVHEGDVIEAYEIKEVARTQ
jgi:translation initiation factor IF-2